MKTLSEPTTDQFGPVLHCADAERLAELCTVALGYENVSRGELHRFLPLERPWTEPAATPNNVPVHTPHNPGQALPRITPGRWRCVDAVRRVGFAARCPR